MPVGYGGARSPGAHGIYRIFPEFFPAFSGNFPTFPGTAPFFSVPVRFYGKFGFWVNFRQGSKPSKEDIGL